MVKYYKVKSINKFNQIVQVLVNENFLNYYIETLTKKGYMVEVKKEC